MNTTKIRELLDEHDSLKQQIKPITDRMDEIRRAVALQCSEFVLNVSLESIDDDDGQGPAYPEDGPSPTASEIIAEVTDPPVPEPTDPTRPQGDSRRFTCPRCGITVTITAGGTLRVHGPKANRCDCSGLTPEAAEELCAPKEDPADDGQTHCYLYKVGHTVYREGETEGREITDRKIDDAAPIYELKIDETILWFAQDDIRSDPWNVTEPTTETKPSADEPASGEPAATEPDPTPASTDSTAQEPADTPTHFVVGDHVRFLSDGNEYQVVSVLNNGELEISNGSKMHTVTTDGLERIPGDDPGADQVIEPARPKTPKKKKAWPKCSVDGCDKNVFMASGDANLCYTHHVESQGK